MVGVRMFGGNSVHEKDFRMDGYVVKRVGENWAILNALEEEIVVLKDKASCITYIRAYLVPFIGF